MTVLLRWLMAAIFTAGGALHLLKPEIYRPVMPGWLPAHGLLILISGVAEIAGGTGLLIPRTRRAAGVGLVLLLMAVFPANVEMLRVYRAQAPWWGTLLLVLRLPLQAVLIWLTWRVARQPIRGADAGGPPAD